MGLQPEKTGVVTAHDFWQSFGYKNVFTVLGIYPGFAKHKVIILLSDFFHLFGNGTHTGSIGENIVVFPPIGKK